MRERERGRERIYTLTLYANSFSTWLQGLEINKAEARRLARYLGLHGGCQGFKYSVIPNMHGTSTNARGNKPLSVIPSSHVYHCM